MSRVRNRTRVPDPNYFIPDPQRRMLKFNDRLPVWTSDHSSVAYCLDEAGRVPHEGLQAEDQRRLSHLQTADCPLLLPCQTLPG